MRADGWRTRSLLFQGGWKHRLFGQDGDSTRILCAVLRVRVRDILSLSLLHSRDHHSTQYIFVAVRLPEILVYRRGGGDVLF